MCCTPSPLPAPCVFSSLPEYCTIHTAVTWYGLRRQNSNWEGADFTNAVVDRVSFDGSSMKVSRRDYYVCVFRYGGYVVLVIYVCRKKKRRNEGRFRSPFRRWSQYCGKYGSLAVSRWYSFSQINPTVQTEILSCLYCVDPGHLLCEDNRVDA